MGIFHAAILLGAMAVAVLVTPLTVRLAHFWGLMDRPDARKMHANPTPRLGGIAIAAGILMSALGAFLHLRRTGGYEQELFLMLPAIAVSGTFVFLVGLVDDIRSVSSRFKLLALIAAAMMVCGSGATLGELRFGGEALVQFHWFTWPVTVLWIVGITVSINFIDGLDGLAAGLSMLAAGVLGSLLISHELTAMAVLPLALCGAIGGFIIFNWHPARTFMGDCGSLTIGFLIGTSTVLANSAIGTMQGVVLPALALSVPLIDACLTFFRRHYLQRRSIFAAEQGHIHHQLLRRGMSHQQAVVTILLVSVLAVVIGLISLSFEGAATLGGLVLVAPLLWGMFRLAGSMRTSEMIDALRSKRNIDRMSKQYRSGFEMLQLEFARVVDFAGWWQGVCRAADRLDFVSLTIPMTSRDGATYSLEWKSLGDRVADGPRIAATVPILDRRAGNEPLQACVEVASTHSLESAGERLALFTRLMHEHSLASLDGRSRSDNGARHSPQDTTGVRQMATRHGPDECGPFGDLRVAVVHDFLYVYAGAERVVEQLIDLFPHCDLFSLFDFLSDSERGFLKGKSVTTSMLQNFPFARTRHRAYLPLMPLSIEQLDVSQYDLVISSSYLAAKGVITGPDQLHICYCHSPARYAWDLQHQYLKRAGIGYGPGGILARGVLHYIRNWDTRSSFGVDHFIANSQFVARRIEKLYRRQAAVIYAPVDTAFFTPSPDVRGDYYVAVGRMVPYKRTDLIVAAFTTRSDLKLKVIGTGPEFEKVRRIAGPNVELLGYQDAQQLRHHLRHAKAMVFAAEEDFGIVPVEAMACGMPVIAYGKGGVTESVIAGRTGLMFDQQTVESLLKAVDQFEAMNFDDELTRAEIRRHAERFSHQRFRDQMTRAVDQWVAAKWPARLSRLPEPVAESAQPNGQASPLAMSRTNHDHETHASAPSQIAVVAQEGNTGEKSPPVGPAIVPANGHANGHSSGPYGPHPV